MGIFDRKFNMLEKIQFAKATKTARAHKTPVRTFLRTRTLWDRFFQNPYKGFGIG